MIDNLSAPARAYTLLRISIVLGGLAGALGVTLLAMAAHTEASGLLQTAAHMLLFHAGIVIVIGILAHLRHSYVLSVALILFTAGLILFCGDLISRAFSASRLFPMAAPAGGLMLIMGWLTLALSSVLFRVKP